MALCEYVVVWVARFTNNSVFVVSICIKEPISQEVAYGSRRNP